MFSEWTVKTIILSQSDALLREAGQVFLQGDAKAQAEIAEKIRILISKHILDKAIAVNSRLFESSVSEPMGGMSAKEIDVQNNKITLHFFSGTAGERVYVSSEGLKLPWVDDYTRSTNRLIREAMQEVFSNAQGKDGDTLTVSFSEKEQ